MITGRTNELRTILHEIELPHADEDAKRIIAIHGLFGVGKSTLLRELMSRIQKHRSADALLSSNEDAHVKYLPEFVFQLLNSFRACQPDTPRFRSDETDARWMRFSQITGDLKEHDASAWQSVEDRSTLRSLSETMEYAPHLGSGTPFDSTIRSRFKSSDDQRLILDTGNVVSEAFMVDLMNTFYPMTDEMTSLADYLNTREPVKVIIVIDTFEKISASMNQWLLENFLPYCYTKRFGDFRSYSSPFLPPDAYVSQFFDFRFIIAGREPLTTTDAERRWDRWRALILELHLDEFSPDLVAEFLKKEGINNLPAADVIMDATLGLPYLVALYADSLKTKKSGADEQQLAARAQERVFWYKSEQQKEWIRAAAFCDWFDADTLRCFPVAHRTSREAYSYLRHSAELTRQSDSAHSKITIHPVIRKSIRIATEQESQKTAKLYSDIATTFYRASTVLQPYNAAFREAIRNLAYFDRFDLEFALTSFIPDELNVVKELLAKSSPLIIKNINTYSLTPPIAEALMEYNRWYDQDVFEAKCGQVTSIWKEREKSLVASRNSIAKEHSETTATLARLETELVTLRKRAEDAQGRAINAEQQSIQAKRMGPFRLHSRDAAALRLSLVLTIILGILWLYSGDLLGGFDSLHEDNIKSASKILAIFTTIFAALTAFFISRALYIRSQRKEREANEESVAQLERKAQTAREELQLAIEERDILAKQMESLIIKKNESQRQLNSIDEILTESYV